MNYVETIGRQIQFNNQFGNRLAGFPLRTCIINEKKNNEIISGGGSLNNNHDEYKRFEDLVIPMGLYTQHPSISEETNVRHATYKTIADDLFDNLFTIVSKPVRKSARTIKNTPISRNNKTKKNTTQ
jgi:hypothetical protein